MDPGQKSLEERYSIVRSQPVDPEKSPAELYGTMESWMFQLGEYRLFLNPVNGTWFWYDRAHDDWRNLPYAAGAGILYLEGDIIGFLPAVVRQPVPEQTGSVPQSPAKKFCGRCGSPITPGKNFCPGCGKPVS